jgi:hypothetical protein
MMLGVVLVVIERMYGCPIGKLPFTNIPWRDFVLAFPIFWLVLVLLRYSNHSIKNIGKRL